MIWKLIWVAFGGYHAGKALTRGPRAFAKNRVRHYSRRALYHVSRGWLA